MKKTFVIWFKEFKSYFSGPGIFVLSLLYTAFLGFSFLALLKHFQEQSFRQMVQMQGQGGGMSLHNIVVAGLISNINLVMLFFVPFLTVRLLTEEKKMRTFDLLLTSPITSVQIVLGKYLAALSVVWVLVLGTLVYPLSLAPFAEIQWGQLGSAYLGILLLTAMYVAVGLFASSLSQSVILSGVISIILTLSLWFIAWTSVMVQDTTMQSVFQHISVSEHFSEFIKGSISVSSIVFCLSVVAIYVFLTERVVESARWRA